MGALNEIISCSSHSAVSLIPLFFLELLLAAAFDQLVWLIMIMGMQKCVVFEKLLCQLKEVSRHVFCNEVAVY